MNDILLSPLRLSELEILIENSVQRAIKQMASTPSAQIDEVLTIQQAAEFLNLKTQTLYGLVSERKIPFSKPTGSRLYFSKLELLEWLKSNRTATIQEQAQQYEQACTLNSHRKGARKAA